jgi:hypothetical protein
MWHSSRAMKSDIFTRRRFQHAGFHAAWRRPLRALVTEVQKLLAA